MARVAVLGAGAWGSALACFLSARLEVSLWARDPAQAGAIAQSRRNERYLPGIEIPRAVEVKSLGGEDEGDGEGDDGPEGEAPPEGGGPAGASGSGKGSGDEEAGQ